MFRKGGSAGPARARRKVQAVSILERWTFSPGLLLTNPVALAQTLCTYKGLGCGEQPQGLGRGSLTRLFGADWVRGWRRPSGA